MKQNFIEKIESTAIIDCQASIGKGNYIGHNTIIKGNVTIGNNNYIGSNVVIGEYAQHSVEKYELYGYEGSYNDKRIKIGSNNVFREFTTVHLPINEITLIDDNCYFMSYSHIPHDAIIDNNVIIANNVQIGGHTHIHQFANIGLSSIIHQKSTIGSYAMIGMGSIITKDILPFLKVIGSPAKSMNQINEWGMKRYGFDNNQINSINDLYFKNILNKDFLINDKLIIKIFKNFYNDNRRKCIFISKYFDTITCKTIKEIK